MLVSKRPALIRGMKWLGFWLILLVGAAATIIAVLE